MPRTSLSWAVAALSVFCLVACGAQPPVSSTANPNVGMPHCNDPQRQDALRCSIELDPDDAGQQIAIVTIDNASTRYSNSEAGQFVLTADRSTRNGNPTAPPFRKGLVNDTDVFCVHDTYLAWFDYGKRPGVLAGLWSLDPATKNFRNFQNSFINGSMPFTKGSPYWDVAPPIEHTFAMHRPQADPKNLLDFLFFATNYARDNPTANWRRIDDGRRDAQGVHYSTRSFMVNWDKHHGVDVSDGRDDTRVTEGDNLIANTVDSTVEYTCTEEGVVTSWTFSPTETDVHQDNLYVAFWLAYGDNEDDTECDAGHAGQQWPHEGYGKLKYVRSSEELHANWNQPNVYAAGSITELHLPPPCIRRHDGTYPDYDNPVISAPHSMQAGSWVEIGEDPNLAPGSKIFRVTLIDEPGSGSGTQSDPLNLVWHDCGAFNENADGTIGIACGIQDRNQPPLKAGIWYRSRLAMSVAQ